MLPTNKEKKLFKKKIWKSEIVIFGLQEVRVNISKRREIFKQHLKLTNNFFFYQKVNEFFCIKKKKWKKWVTAINTINCSKKFAKSYDYLSYVSIVLCRKNWWCVLNFEWIVQFNYVVKFVTSLIYLYLRICEKYSSKKSSYITRKFLEFFWLIFLTTSFKICCF
jgi:hypothetical protein